MRNLGICILLTALAWGQAPNRPASGDSKESAPALTAKPDTGSDRPAALVVPAGTKIPLSLKQAISTKTARQGDPVYAETAFPVAMNGRMLIPAGTYVQGTIDRVRRPGRVKGKAELLMHFTTLIFPNGYTLLMPASVDRLPGAAHEKTKGEEGTIQEDGQTGQKIGTAASTAATGAVVGGLSSGGKGALIGSGIGGAAGLAIAMLTRGNDVRLEPGTSIEMIMQRELPLDPVRSHAPAN